VGGPNNAGISGDVYENKKSGKSFFRESGDVIEKSAA